MKAEKQDIIQAIPTINVIDELRDEVSHLSEKNTKEHGKFSKDIQALDRKLDEMLEAQRREKRKEEVKNFILKSDLGFEVFAGKASLNESSNDFMRFWIKIPNKEQTDFEYVILDNIPEIRNYYHLKIFEGKTYNLPCFYPRGSVLISVSTSAIADGNGFTPNVFHRYWFNIDTHEVAPVGDFSKIGEYFTAVEIVTGRNLSKIFDKIDKYIKHPTGKNVLVAEKLYSYDINKGRCYYWYEREER